MRNKNFFLNWMIWGVSVATLLVMSCNSSSSDEADTGPNADGSISDSAQPEDVAADAWQPTDTSGADSSEDLGLPPGSRTFTFINECPFEVWVKATGGNTQKQPCSTDGECLNGQRCGGKYCYCSSDDQCGGTTKCLCTDGSTSCNDLDKRCHCEAIGQCPHMQECNLETKSCFWVFPQTPRLGHWKLQAHGSADNTASVDITASNGSRIVWSGNIAGATGCNEQGLQCTSGDCGGDGNTCPAGVGSTPPATLAEFTLQKSDWPDTYDVEVIDGFNLPLEMKPAPGAQFKPLSDQKLKNFWCGNPGGVGPYSPASGATMADWPANGCTWEFNFQSLSQPLAYVAIKKIEGARSCSAHSECSDQGGTCGVTLEQMRDAPHNTDRTCGEFRGYWSPKYTCSLSNGAVELPPYQCNQTIDSQYGPYGNVWHLYMCDQGVDSCYNTSSQTCCGCADWKLNEQLLPADRSCQGHNDMWQQYVLPVLAVSKMACPMAYVYPYDDHSSTFTCDTVDSPRNINYTFTYCPGGKTGRP